MSVKIKKGSEAEMAAVLDTVDRAVAELRRGSAVVVLSGTGSVLARPAETINSGPLPFFARPGIGKVSVAVTGRRAAILGLASPAAPAVILQKNDGFSPQTILELIDPKAGEHGDTPD